MLKSSFSFSFKRPPAQKTREVGSWFLGHEFIGDDLVGTELSGELSVLKVNIRNKVLVKLDFLNLGNGGEWWKGQI